MSRGTIRQRGPESWEIRLRVPNPDTGRSEQRSWTVRGDRTDAERELAIRVTELLDGRLQARERTITLGAHAQEWIDVHGRRVSRKTISSYRSLLNAHVLPTLGGYKVRELTTRQIDGLYARLISSGLSPRTVRYVHVVLRRCLEDAVRWGVATANPAMHATPPSAPKKKLDVWDTDDARRFLDTLDEHPHPAGGVWKACLLLGLRRGEALGLQWGDLDYDGGAIRVERSYGRDGDAGKRFKAPKTASSRRIIPVDERTHKWLESIRPLGARPGDLIFCHEAGTPLDPDWVSKSFGNYCVDHGLPPIRLHDLRHTFASLALEAGVPMKVVSEWLGHSGIGVTGDIYSHVSDAFHREQASRIGEMLFPEPLPDDD